MKKNKEVKSTKSTKSAIKDGFKIALLSSFFICGVAFAQDITSIIPNAKAGKDAWDIFAIVSGSIMVGTTAMYLSQIAKGIAMGLTVKRWNLISPDVSFLRFGTADGYYDSKVEKIGWFAIHCKCVDPNGNTVVDRVPHGSLVNGRVTVVGGQSVK